MSTTPSSCSNIMYVRRSCMSGGTSTSAAGRRCRRAALAIAAASIGFGVALEQPVVGASRCGAAAPRRRPRAARSGGARGAATTGRPNVAPASNVPSARRTAVLDGALDLPAIAKAHLGLGRMHVDVDHVRGDDDVEEERRTHAGGNRRSIRGFGGAHDARRRAPRGRSPRGTRAASPCRRPPAARRVRATWVVPLTSSTSSRRPANAPP